jgi:ELWxxDGT repeat protein
VSLTYFQKDNGGNQELWVTDGTPAGTQRLKVLGGLNATNLTVIGARAYFTFDDGVHGMELWTSDGTAAGTMMVSDIESGSNGSTPGQLTNVNGTLFFQANDGVHGVELWRSDGTAAGTTMVKDIAPGGPASSGDPVFLTNVNGELFFQASDGTNGFELWKSDGTAGGTVMVADINPGSGSSSPELFTDVNGTIFFQADDGLHGSELWKTDGTAAGTMLVKDINPLASGSFPQQLTNVNGTLFFAAGDPTHGIELWKSDGTAAGTVLVKDIDAGGNSSSPQDLVNFNGTLFFAADDGAHGVELWKSDGTAAGTMMVKDINPTAGGSDPFGFVNLNGTLFFAANDGTNGIELWKSDGTAAGTVMVKDIDSGTGSSDPSDLSIVNGALEFLAFDGTGIGLFRSDGTAAGTVELVPNVDAVPFGVAPQMPPQNDANGDFTSDILWRNSNGTLAGWSINLGAISSSSFLTVGGAVIAPDASWSVAGISDFNGDGKADVLWRNTDGTLADWTMRGTVIASSATVASAGGPVKPDASWSIAGVGDFNGDTRSDVLWRNASGELTEWQMTGATISASGDVTSGGVAVRPDASWSAAAIGDFNGDGRKDILWRNNSGEVTAWLMNGTAIAGSSDLTSGGVAARPDASWSVAGVGDFNHDGRADILWRNSSGALAEWLMNGTTITGSGSITSGGVAVAPDATWHIVEIGDFNADGNADILWRNNSGALAEWLMNGTTITSSFVPTSNGTAISPDASWSTQAKPTMS